MEYSYLRELDEFFCAQFSDYVRLSAIEGYKMPEMVTVGADGNIERKDFKYMRLCYQPEKESVLKAFKAGLTDTEFTFAFTFPSAVARFRDLFRKETFAKTLPGVLKRYGETPASAGEKLALEERVWKGIVKGRLYPEKSTVMALALVCRMKQQDVETLLSVCGFRLSRDNVRDIVFEYLINQGIFNEDMRNACLAEYAIDTLPIAK